MVDIEILALLEDQYFGMIVKGKRFFRGLIVDDNWAQRRIRFKDFHEIESQLALDIDPAVRCDNMK